MSHNTTVDSFCVYKITNLITHKVYIGLTTRGIKKRWQDHVNAANNRSSTVLHNSIRKYGTDNFFIEVIEECPDFETMIAREIHWIQEYNSIRPNGYNITAGGQGSLGLRPTDEQRRQMSIRRQGRPLSPETRMKLSKASTGRRHLPFELRPKPVGRKGRLTNEQVAIIKFNGYGLMHREYASLFGISRASVGLIVNGLTYQHVTIAHFPHHLYRQMSFWDNDNISGKRQDLERDSKGRYIPGATNWKTRQRNDKGQFLSHQEGGDAYAYSHIIKDSNG